MSECDMEPRKSNIDPKAVWLLYTFCFWPLLVVPIVFLMKDWLLGFELINEITGNIDRLDFPDLWFFDTNATLGRSINDEANWGFFTKWFAKLQLILSVLICFVITLIFKSNKLELDFMPANTPTKKRKKSACYQASFLVFVFLVDITTHRVSSSTPGAQVFFVALIFLIHYFTLSVSRLFLTNISKI